MNLRTRAAVIQALNAILDSASRQHWQAGSSIVDEREILETLADIETRAKNALALLESEQTEEDGQ